MNPDRDSSSKWGDGRLSEEGDVSENLRILGYSPSYRSRLVADQGPWGQGCERTTFRCSDSFVKPKSVRLPHAWNSRDVRQLARGSHGAPCLGALALSGCTASKPDCHRELWSQRAWAGFPSKDWGSPILTSPLHEML